MDYWFILILTGLIVIVTIVGCHIATYLGVGFSGMFQGYINRYIDGKLKDRIELLEERAGRVENEGVIERFAVDYSNNPEIKNAWNEFNNYLLWNQSALDDIKSRLDALYIRRKMKMTSGGTELWFGDRRPGLTRSSR